MGLLNEMMDNRFFGKSVFGESSYISPATDYSFPIKTYDESYVPELKIGDRVFIDDLLITRANSIWGTDKNFNRIFGDLFKYSNCTGRVTKISSRQVSRNLKNKKLWTITVTYPNKKKVDVNNALILKKEIN